MVTARQQQLRRGRIVFGFGVALVAGAMLFLYCFDPQQHSFLPGCPFHTLTGWNCPGCGSTRALHQLLHGHWGAAFGLNPLTVSALPFVALAGVWYLVQAWRGQPLREPFLKPIWIRTLLGVIVLFGVLRNVPWPARPSVVPETTNTRGGIHE